MRKNKPAAKPKIPLTVDMFDEVMATVHTQHMDAIDEYANRDHIIRYKLLQDEAEFRARLRNGFHVLLNCFKGERLG